MNSCDFVGRVTAAPTLKYENDTAVCKFFLAVKRDRTQEADFVPCFILGSYAESMANALKKGQLIAVQAKFRSTNFVDDANRRSVFYEFKVITIEFLD